MYTLVIIIVNQLVVMFIIRNWRQGEGLPSESIDVVHTMNKNYSFNSKHTMLP
jgi:hypothetical protein